MIENTYTKKEQLTALFLCGAAKEAVKNYAKECDQDAAWKAAILQAAEYVNSGIDFSVLDELTYEKQLTKEI